MLGGKTQAYRYLFLLMVDNVVKSKTPFIDCCKLII